MGYNLSDSCNLQKWISLYYWVWEVVTRIRHDELCEINARTQSCILLSQKTALLFISSCVSLWLEYELVITFCAYKVTSKCMNSGPYFRQNENITILIQRTFLVQQYIFFTGWGCQSHAQPPSWRTRVSHFVWVITLDLPGMERPTSS